MNNYIQAGIKKGNMTVIEILCAGFFAGAFIAFGALGSQIASACIENQSIAKLIGSAIFPIGLTMVIMVGTELFTGNCLLLIPASYQKITVKQMIRNLALSYIGNFIGSLFVATLVVTSGLSGMFKNKLAENMASTALSKTSLSFTDALVRGILCNILVCVAVWISFVATDTAGKIIGLYLPTMLFVLCGFEHCIANMYFIPVGMMSAHRYGIQCNVTIGNFLLLNLLPVTLGNLIGGLFVASFIAYSKQKDIKEI